MIAYVIFALSFRKEYGVMFSHYACIIILVRQAIRFLDFENTKPFTSSLNWNFVLIW